MGSPQPTIAGQSPASSRATGRWPPQACLRKGCGNVFRPRRWNQRYCQDEQCRRELQRWQNSQRQQRRRQRPAARRQHAERERTRRQQQRLTARDSETSPLPAQAPAPTPDSAGGGAWSRGKKKSVPFCQRPGCYEPRPQGGRLPFRYCGHACGSAMRRVMERERKRLRRRTLRTEEMRSIVRTVPQDAALVATTNEEATAPNPTASISGGCTSGVRNSRLAAGKAVSSRLTPDDRTTATTHPHRLEEVRHDRKTTAHPRPRPPPAS